MSAIQSAAFLLPAVLLIGVGLLYPAIVTIYQSFRNAAGNELRRPRQLPDDLHRQRS